jgi:hypothetical protein
MPTDLRFACTATVPLVVPIPARGVPGRVRLRAVAEGSHGTSVARLTVRCLD